MALKNLLIVTSLYSVSVAATPALFIAAWCTATYNVVNSFSYNDGAYPNGSLVQAADGKLYGMTTNGGGYGLAVALSMSADGSGSPDNSFDGGKQVTHFFESSGNTNGNRLAHAQKRGCKDYQNPVE